MRSRQSAAADRCQRLYQATARDGRRMRRSVAANLDPKRRHHGRRPGVQSAGVRTTDALYEAPAGDFEHDVDEETRNKAG